MGQAPEKFDIFEHQPEECRKPLPYKELTGVDGYLLRVMFFDPTELYARVGHLINPFNRYNWTVQFPQLFPKRKDGLCVCGCGEVAKGQYANKDCQMFAIACWNVMGGRQEFIGMVLDNYTGSKMCMKCGERKWTEVDHIVPVSGGGGGSWLSNYQNLCKKCHTEKTRSDFGWEKLKTSKDYE